MRKKRHTADQIIAKLREAEVALSQGGTVPEACRKLGIAEQTYYRLGWTTGVQAARAEVNGAAGRSEPRAAADRPREIDPGRLGRISFAFGNVR